MTEIQLDPFMLVVGAIGLLVAGGSIGYAIVEWWFSDISDPFLLVVAVVTGVFGLFCFILGVEVTF